MWEHLESRQGHCAERLVVHKLRAELPLYCEITEWWEREVRKRKPYNKEKKRIGIRDSHRHSCSGVWVHSNREIKFFFPFPSVDHPLARRSKFHDAKPRIVTVFVPSITEGACVRADRVASPSQGPLLIGLGLGKVGVPTRCAWEIELPGDQTMLEFQWKVGSHFEFRVGCTQVTWNFACMEKSVTLNPNLQLSPL